MEDTERAVEIEPWDTELLAGTDRCRDDEAIVRNIRSIATGATFIWSRSTIILQITNQIHKQCVVRKHKPCMLPSIFGNKTYLVNLFKNIKKVFRVKQRLRSCQRNAKTITRIPATRSISYQPQTLQGAASRHKNS